MAGRKRTGTLVWTGKQYSARIANGPLTPLLTDDKRIANARLRQLVANPDTAPTSAVETVTEAARRLVAVQLTAGVPSAPARQSRLERWALPRIGHLAVTDVRPGHVADVLEHVASLGKSSTTITHMRGDLLFVFGRLMKEEVLGRNPARGDLVDTPAGTDDPRPRVLLRDAEFVALVEAPTTPPQLRMLSIVSRAFGGMRTSDLRAWLWEHVDLSGWGWSDVPRPKTSRKRRRRPGDSPFDLKRLVLPPAVADELRAWWISAGRPRTGPVFDFPDGRKSYAADLRRALELAGVDRHEVHHDTPKTRRVDFHSFRRAWSTAVANSGLNAQTAMQVTGHSQMATHMLYVRPEALDVPDAAVPKWKPGKSTIDLSKPPPGVQAPPGVPPGVYNSDYGNLCEGEDSNLHGSYPASTSIQSDRIGSGTFVHCFEPENHESVPVIEESARNENNRVGKVVGQNLSDQNQRFPDPAWSKSTG